MITWKQQRGFTLIELVVVIVILGILAATALPKFVDLSSDARKAAIQGLEGAVKSAANLAYAKAAVSSQTGATGSISVDGTTVGLIYGYPNKTDVEKLLQDDAGTTYVVGTGTNGTWSLPDRATCSVTYTEATASAAAQVTKNVAGC